VPGEGEMLDALLRDAAQQMTRKSAVVYRD
jgi:hypothetical protein